MDRSWLQNLTVPDNPEASADVIARMLIEHGYGDACTIVNAALNLLNDRCSDLGMNPLGAYAMLAAIGKANLRELLERRNVNNPALADVIQFTGVTLDMIEKATLNYATEIISKHGTRQDSPPGS